MSLHPMTADARHLLTELSNAGLVLHGARRIHGLHDDVRAELANHHDVDSASTLLLLGQAGRRLWDTHVSNNLDRADPFDETSVELVRQAFDRHAPDASVELVYPGPAAMPLGRLAESIGWGLSSPLGLTIHPTWGLWLAHRVVVLTSLVIDESASFDPTLHPCLSCIDTPCVRACPTGAVDVEQGFDVRACAEFRALEGSSCAYSCHARLACPVGADHRYSEEQMHHHYSAGLRSVRRWVQQG